MCHSSDALVVGVIGGGVGRFEWQRDLEVAEAEGDGRVGEHGGQDLLGNG
jgi:hypothetical protein